VLYVEPGWAGVSAWLIDAAVIALAAIVAAGGLYAARTAGDLVDDATRRSAQIEALAAGVGVLVVAPLIYGLFYASGRAGGRWAGGSPAPGSFGCATAAASVSRPAVGQCSLGHSASACW